MLHIIKCIPSVCFKLRRNAIHTNTRAIARILLVERGRPNEEWLNAKYRKILSNFCSWLRYTLGSLSEPKKVAGDWAAKRR